MHRKLPNPDGTGLSVLLQIIRCIGSFGSSGRIGSRSTVPIPSVFFLLFAAKKRHADRLDFNPNFHKSNFTYSSRNGTPRNYFQRTLASIVDVSADNTKQVHVFLNDAKVNLNTKQVRVFLNDAKTQLESKRIEYPNFPKNGEYFSGPQRWKRSTDSTNREDQPPDGRKKSKLSDWSIPSQVMSCSIHLRFKREIK